MNILDEVTLEADQPSPARGHLVPSAFQSAIYSEVSREGSDLLIQAVAGSGKTTTIIKAMEFAPGGSLFMAFNKAIAEDIRRRASAGTVKTLNALGHGLMLSNRGGDLNARKVSDIVKKIMGDTTEQKELGYTISRLVGCAKNLAYGIELAATAGDFYSLTSDSQQGSDIPAEHAEMAANVAFEAFEQSRLDTKTFDFDDQLWVPVSEGWAFPHYENVFIDEAQDLSPIQHEMLGRLKTKHTRIVAVGDRHQAIYGFRGADSESMDTLKELFSMKELPLSVCYRCSDSVVSEAKMFCPEISSRDGAPPGLVIQNTADPEHFGSEYMVVCRNNAPLFRAILQRVRRKEPCQVLSNFLDSLTSFVRGFKTTYTSDLQTKLDRWRDKELDAAKTKSKMHLIRDKHDTLSMFCKEFTQTDDILRLLMRLKDSRAGPIFATIHKAKGLESEHIYLLRPDLLYRGDEDDAARRQAENLHYVAITRAKETLTYGVSWK